MGSGTGGHRCTHKLVQTNCAVKRSRPKRSSAFRADPSRAHGGTFADCPADLPLFGATWFVNFHTGSTDAVLRPHTRGYSARVVTQ
ncbi:hypothetical protein FRZ03_38655 [Streptomyces misionensis]|uniref:Uncharacterized protein n=1 Tax=Streptomyces misionensis TaxID=67331 RepID=A0A5C6IB20_9ACTN|nr:hypothetical protein FRZ03_38655 [Streptomyces misionensis]